MKSWFLVSRDYDGILRSVNTPSLYFGGRQFSKNILAPSYCTLILNSSSCYINALNALICLDIVSPLLILSTKFASLK
jgi:hypothetical protein